MEPLTKRIAQVLNKERHRKEKEEAISNSRKPEPKDNPVAKTLDHLYETLADSPDSKGALDIVIELTKQLDLAEEVSFEVPEEKEEEKDPSESYEAPEDEQTE
jgi:hypothetical protein